MTERALSDALIATSSASAILWTGVLIVVQLGRERAAPGPEPDDAQSAPYAFRPLFSLPKAPTMSAMRSVSEVRSLNALVMLGFGLIAPIFALFLSGIGLRVAAAAFVLYYTKDTVLNARFFASLARSPNLIPETIKERGAYRAVLKEYTFLSCLQYAMMVAVAAFPSREVVLYFSVAMLFLGYQMMLGRYIELRRPFAP